MVDVATGVLIDALTGIAAGERPLVAWEETGALAVALAAGGASPCSWRRFATDTTSGAAWPDASGSLACTSAFIRLAKAKDALDLALHATSASIPPRAPIIVFGANDEGIRSAARHLEAVADDIVTLETRRHCRVIAGRRRPSIANHRATLAAWRSSGTIELLGQRRNWIAYPGVFAKGGIDEGTALLLAHLPPTVPRTGSGQGQRVLDFAAGTGVIAAAVRMTMPEAAVDLIEIDALALESAGENVPGARLIAGASLNAAGAGSYNLILSNPPIHEGVAEDHRVLASFIADAPRHLVRGGELRIVVQRRIPATELMQRAFGNVQVIAETGRFRILSARR